MRTERLERARTLAEPYRERAGVIGALVAGSSTRDYVDRLADLDLFVIWDDDAYDALPARERYVLLVSEDLPRRKDVEILCKPRRALLSLVSSTLDSHHATYAEAETLFARDGELAELVARVAILPEADRQARLRVHYRELLWVLEKVKKARQREARVNARLIESAAFDAVRKLLFVEVGHWPAKRDWATQELERAGVPEPLRAAFATAVLAEQPALEELRRAIDAWLTERGHDFHHNTFALSSWIDFTDEGIVAVARWSGLY